jgi:hypothetical protein
MADRQELDIHISQDGTVTLDVRGAKGASCLDLTKDLEESLGFVLDRERKASFYENEDTEKTRIRSE